MNRRLAMCFLLLFAGLALSTRAQDIQVNRENKTVAISVTKSIEVQPELGSVQIGYRNQGLLQSSVYEENGRQAQKIIESLLIAGVKKEDIQTEEVQLVRVDESPQESQHEKPPRFEAVQTWKIWAPVGEVQKVVDQAVAAGANDVSEVVWSVADPDALDVKARGEAISKARQIADEMAKSLGGKAGSLLYISNGEPSGSYFRAGGGFRNGRVQTVEVSGTRLPLLNLFPQKVRREVTIYVVFALE
jgi:uncharacterized protein YggE